MDVALEEEQQPVEPKDLVELVDSPIEEKKCEMRAAEHKCCVL